MRFVNSPTQWKDFLEVPRVRRRDYIPVLCHFFASFSSTYLVKMIRVVSGFCAIHGRTPKVVRNCPSSGRLIVSDHICDCTIRTSH